MKKNILIGLAVLFTLLLSGCKANYPVAQQTGKEDVAYLLFVSQKNNLKDPLSVQVDNTTFEAKAVKAKKANRRGDAYTVATGRRKLTVKDQAGNVLYNKEVMLSAQETKQIILP